MNKNGRYAFYGSLRNGMYNHGYFKNGLEYLGTETITGFKLFSLGSYPCIIETGNEEDTVVVDLFNADNATATRIHSMERGAGYDYKDIEINGKDFGIYTYTRDSLNALSDRHVPGGDWVKYLHDRNATKKV